MSERFFNFAHAWVDGWAKLLGSDKKYMDPEDFFWREGAEGVRLARERKRELEEQRRKPRRERCGRHS